MSGSSLSKVTFEKHTFAATGLAAASGFANLTVPDAPGVTFSIQLFKTGLENASDSDAVGRRQKEKT